MANLSTLIRAKDADAVAAKADGIKKLVENAIGAVRSMALLLRPSMLDDLGLVPALQWQAREVSKRNGVRVKVAGRAGFRRTSRRAQDLRVPDCPGSAAQLRATLGGLERESHGSSGARPPAAIRPG